MKFSIVIPVYNCGSRLHVSVDSILSQTFRDFELVLVNDGSKDNSLAVCRSYAERDQRIRVLDQANAGAGPARNHGISESKGEYLIFCDADDYYESDALENFAAVTESKPDLIISSYREFRYDASGNVLVCGQRIMQHRSVRDQQAVRATYMDFRRQSVITAPWAKAYRRELVTAQHIGFADLRRCQDVAFNLYYYEHVRSVEVIPQITYNYQTPDDDSYLKKFPVNMFEIHKTIYQLTKDSLIRWGVFDASAKKFLDTHLQRDAVILLRLNYQNNWKLNSKQKKQLTEQILNDSVMVESTKTKVSGTMNKVIKMVLRSQKIYVVDLFSRATLMYQAIDRR